MRDINFTLKNNKKRTCFYVNNCIDNNNWHNTWHFKNVKIIILQLQWQNERFSQNSMNMHKIYLINIHEMYNFSSINYNEILSRKSLFVLKQTLRISEKNVIVNNFNLHHFHWNKLLYFKQHLLSNDLLIVMRFIDATLSLFKNTIIKNYYWFVFCNTESHRQTYFLRNNSWNEKFIQSFIYWHNLWFKNAKEIKTTI